MTEYPMKWSASLPFKREVCGPEDTTYLVEIGRIIRAKLFQQYPDVRKGFVEEVVNVDTEPVFIWWVSMIAGRHMAGRHMAGRHKEFDGLYIYISQKKYEPKFWLWSEEGSNWYFKDPDKLCCLEPFDSIHDILAWIKVFL